MFELTRVFNGHGKGLDPVEKAWADFALPALGWAPQASAPPADVTESEDEIVIAMDLPGHRPEEIQIKFENDVLTVLSERRYGSDKAERQHRSERAYGRYFRSFALPASVDAQRTEAKYEHGVLTITLPKREEAKPRTIEVKVR